MIGPILPKGIEYARQRVQLRRGAKGIRLCLLDRQHPHLMAHLRQQGNGVVASSYSSHSLFLDQPHVVLAYPDSCRSTTRRSSICAISDRSSTWVSSEMRYSESAIESSIARTFETSDRLTIHSQQHIHSQSIINKLSKHGLQISTFAYLVLTPVREASTVFFFFRREEDPQDMAIWVKGELVVGFS